MLRARFLKYLRTFLSQYFQSQGAQRHSVREHLLSSREGGADGLVPGAGKVRRLRRSGQAHFRLPRQREAPPGQDTQPAQALHPGVGREGTSAIPDPVSHF